MDGIAKFYIGAFTFLGLIYWFWIRPIEATREIEAHKRNTEWWQKAKLPMIFSKDNIVLVGTLPNGNKLYKISVITNETAKHQDEKYNDTIYWIDDGKNYVSINKILTEQYGKYFIDRNTIKVLTTD